MNTPPRLQMLSSYLLRLLLAGVIIQSFSTPAVAPAQTAAPATSPTPDPSLQRRPLDIENSQPDPNEEYLLGAGDDITVTVVGRPELSGNHVVGPDGRITLPVVGSVKIGDKSRDDAAKAIDTILGNYYTGTISSTVQVTKYGSNHILLLGAVEHPGVVTFDQPPSLLEAVTKAGSVINPDHTAQMPQKCIVYRGDDKVMNVNIGDRLSSQKALQNIRLRRDDIVYFPEHQENIVSVLGEVNKPGPVKLYQNSTLISLLANAGGITEKAGNPVIQIVEPSTGKVQKVKFKDLLDVHGGSDITLHDGDIVFVPRSGLAKTGFFFQQISPMTSLGTIATFAAQ